MRIPLPIETERLVIRPFDPDGDVEAMARVFLDPEVMRYIPGGVLPDVDDVRTMLVRYAEEQTERGFTFWAIADRGTAEVVGEVGLGIFAQTGDVELGYTLARDRWGRGYATEAARAVVEYGLGPLGLPEVLAEVDEGNAASVAVVKRLGMAAYAVVPGALGPMTRYRKAAGTP